MTAEPFAFNQKYYVFPGDVLDLSVINAVVPSPSAEVDIDEALKQYKIDLQNVDSIYSWGSDPNIEGHFRILLNMRDWSLFWSVRHPNEAVREIEKLELREFNASIERVTAKARKCLQRRMQ